MGRLIKLVIFAIVLGFVAYYGIMWYVKFKNRPPKPKKQKPPIIITDTRKHRKHERQEKREARRQSRMSHRARMRNPKNEQDYGDNN
jgi:hypothetical protein